MDLSLALALVLARGTQLGAMRVSAFLMVAVGQALPRVPLKDRALPRARHLRPRVPPMGQRIATRGMQLGTRMMQLRATLAVPL